MAIDVIDAAADFCSDFKSILLIPILYFILTVLVFLVWFGCMLCVVSMNDISASPDQSLFPQKKDLVWKKNVEYMALAMLFGILWIMAWLDYTGKFIIMVCASFYYFGSSATQDCDNINMGLGFKYAHFYHTGSIAFGAFIIALIQFIRIVFMYLAQQAEKASGGNPAVKLIVACGACILKCIEKICDYINQAAYAYMAVSGDSFLSSAWSGFLLNVKHMLKFSFANTIAKIFILLGKLTVTVGNCFSFLFVLKRIAPPPQPLTSIWSPVIIIGLFSFITASIFLSVFETAVMALMTCLAIDIDLNGEDSTKWGPATFHDSMDKQSKKVKSDKKGNDIA